jgi:hypothetical protein
LGLDLLVLYVETPRELDTAFATIAVERVDALQAGSTNFTYANRHLSLPTPPPLPSIGRRLRQLMNYDWDLSTLFATRNVRQRIIDGATRRFSI